MDKQNDNPASILPRIDRGNGNGVAWGNLSERERRMVSPNIATRCAAFIEALTERGVTPREMNSDEVSTCRRKLALYESLHGMGAKAVRCAAHSIYTEGYLLILNDQPGALAHLIWAKSMMAEAGGLVLDLDGTAKPSPRTVEVRDDDEAPVSLADALGSLMLDL